MTRQYSRRNMEEYYRKKKNGRYELVGYHGMPDLTPGLWLIERNDHGRSYKNLFYRLDDIPDLCEVKDMVLCTMVEEHITNAIVKWCKGSEAGHGASPLEIAHWVTKDLYEQLQIDKEKIKEVIGKL